VGGSCENGNEPSDSIEEGSFLTSNCSRRSLLDAVNYLLIFS
jgi:hypothetical protein